MVIDRITDLLKYQFTCSKWEIDNDILTSTQSTFMVDNFSNYDHISNGDFVIVKSVGETFRPTTQVQTFSDYYSCMYIGLVDSFEDLKITTRPLTEIYNISVPIQQVWKAANPSIFVKQITDSYVLTADRYLTNVKMFQLEGDIDWSIVQDKPKEYNLTSLLQNLYKTTQFSIQPLGFSYNRTNKKFGFALLAHQGGTSKDVYYLDRNNYFAKPSIYVRPENVGNSNSIMILYKNIYYTFYLTEKNEITNDYTNVDVHKPVSKIGYVYTEPTTKSTTADAEPEPTPEEIAKRELKTQTYQHEITFEVDYRYPKIEEITDLGHKVIIGYQGKRYDSVVTKWSAKSEDQNFSITCGNVRSTLQFAIDETYD